MDEQDVWIMHGLPWDDPLRIRTPAELTRWIDEVGFLPLFRNAAKGFSVEEHVFDGLWWTGDPEEDPWMWREQLAREGHLAYGRFFGGKMGFISREWFPHFANWRRDGYDFDARWEDAKASMREKKIMDLFLQQEEWYTYQLKQAAGFGKGGEKNFSGILTNLQMEGYLVVRDFRQRTNRKGTPYGMPISVYITPETLFSEEHVRSVYDTDPAVSKQLIYEQVQRCFPEAEEKALQHVLGK